MKSIQAATDWECPKEDATAYELRPLIKYLTMKYSNKPGLHYYISHKLSVFEYFVWMEGFNEGHRVRIIDFLKQLHRNPDAVPEDYTSE